MHRFKYLWYLVLCYAILCTEIESNEMRMECNEMQCNTCMCIGLYLCVYVRICVLCTCTSKQSRKLKVHEKCTDEFGRSHPLQKLCLADLGDIT